MKLHADEYLQLYCLIREGEFLSARDMLDRLARVQSSGLLRRWIKAVERIETYFNQATGFSPWNPEWPPASVDNARKKVAGFVSAFGSAAPLLNDVENSLQLKPRSLNYYLVTARGEKASRWDLLLSLYKVRKWEQQKAEENAAAQKIADKLKINIRTEPVDVLKIPWVKASIAELKLHLKNGRARRAARLIQKLNSFDIDVAELLDNPNSSAVDALPSTINSTPDSPVRAKLTT